MSERLVAWYAGLELGFRWRDLRCRVLGHRIEVVAVGGRADGGADSVEVCQRGCGHYRYL